jgi:hypothetical protein
MDAARAVEAAQLFDAAPLPEATDRFLRSPGHHLHGDRCRGRCRRPLPLSRSQGAARRYAVTTATSTHSPPPLLRLHFRQSALVSSMLPHSLMTATSTHSPSALLRLLFRQSTHVGFELFTA